MLYKNKDIWNKYSNDDQIIINNICKKEYNFFNENTDLDKKEDIFFITNGFPPFQFKKLKMENGRLINKKYNNTPSVLHLPGNLNGNKYISYIGYRPQNIKLDYEYYKINQLIDLLKHNIRIFINNINRTNNNTKIEKVIYIEKNRISNIDYRKHLLSQNLQ